ncbi:hypothetical protein B0H17DRAFT_1146099 [Mycena rosella]|uniref:DUF7730 domain-containing protein n=1 Tax=Mycena rosella TaxID=1033263 RepID=A0AAD7CQC0_MYCRO|nr:hypothetical protein B0H17DRAFT_1146099 [Mycena rosella]
MQPSPLQMLLFIICPCLCNVSQRRPRPRQYTPSPGPARPKQYIEIPGTPQAEQPPNCHLLKLPLELRQRIYELALGGRVIGLKRVRSAPKPATAVSDVSSESSDYVVQSTCYEISDSPNGSSNIFGVTEGIPTALLLSCRQVYFEALPILHRCNTFHAQVGEFEEVLLAALGRHYLPDIRNIYLCYSYSTLNSVRPQWTAVFALLRQMRLQSLTFEFQDRLEGTELDPAGAVLDSPWARGVLGIRNLRRFELFFKNGASSEYSQYRINLAERLREVVVQPRAKEPVERSAEDAVPE